MSLLHLPDGGTPGRPARGALLGGTRRARRTIADLEDEPAAPPRQTLPASLRLLCSPAGISAPRSAFQLGGYFARFKKKKSIKFTNVQSHVQFETVTRTWALGPSSDFGWLRTQKRPISRAHTCKSMCGVSGLDLGLVERTPTCVFKRDVRLSLTHLLWVPSAVTDSFTMPAGLSVRSALGHCLFLSLQV